MQGRVQWEGELDTDELEVLATPMPQSIAASGSAAVQVSGSDLTRRDGHIDYDMTLDTVMEAQVTTERRVLGVTVARRRQPHVREVVSHYVVRVTTPEGWQATPAEYTLIQDTKHVDFVLRRDTSVEE